MPEDKPAFLNHNTYISIGLLVIIAGVIFSAGKLHTDVSDLKSKQPQIDKIVVLESKIDDMRQTLRDIRTDIGNLNRLRDRTDLTKPGAVEAPR